MAKSSINTVLFDMGGVLIPGSMETILFTPKYGLVDQLSLDKDRVKKEMIPSYLKFAHVGKSKEKDFWKELGKRLSVEFPMDLVKETSDKLIIPNSQAENVFKMLKELSFRIGIASNNTAFWYDKYSSMLNLDKYVDSELVFVSHTFGKRKTAGLLHHIAESVNPNETLFIDDQEYNLIMAKELGFHTEYYLITDKSMSLMNTVKKALNL